MSRQKSKYSEPSLSHAETLLTTADMSLTLKRFPTRKKETLQAWDSADDLLIQQRLVDKSVECPDASEETSTNALVLDQPIAAPILVFNDSFGALALAFGDYEGVSVTDSFVAAAATQQNEQLNAPRAALPVQAITEPLPDAKTVLLKVPKSQSLLRYQLDLIAARLPAGTTIIVAAKSKALTPSVRTLFEQFLDSVTVSLAYKKARILTGQLAAKVPAARPPMHGWMLPGSSIELHHLPGVFARKNLDVGARLLLENLPETAATDVIDLGCGNGVLGLSYAKRHPAAQVTWVDESYLSIASVQQNIRVNLTESEQYTAVVDDCLSSFPDQSTDLILCNPPFHQEHTITDHIAQQMFRDAYRVLRKGGELRIVGNRHLGYHQILKRLFGDCDLIANNAKFVILSVTRP